MPYLPSLWTKSAFTGLLLACSIPLTAVAQRCDPNSPSNPLRDSIESLAGGEARASMSTRRLAECDAAVATPIQRFQHGSECLMAALRARELGNASRALALFEAAKASLLVARAQLDPRAPVLRSRASYFLGLMAETCDHDFRTAARYYAEAHRLSSADRQAEAALARVQTHLNRRVKFGG